MGGLLDASLLFPASILLDPLCLPWHRFARSGLSISESWSAKFAMSIIGSIKTGREDIQRGMRAVINKIVVGNLSTIWDSSSTLS